MGGLVDWVRIESQEAERVEEQFHSYLLPPFYSSSRVLSVSYAHGGTVGAVLSTDKIWRAEAMNKKEKGFSLDVLGSGTKSLYKERDTGMERNSWSSTTYSVHISERLDESIAMDKPWICKEWKRRKGKKVGSLDAGEMFAKWWI